MLSNAMACRLSSLALVTGRTKGIGEAVAARLREAGATVFAAARKASQGLGEATSSAAARREGRGARLTLRPAPWLTPGHRTPAGEPRAAAAQAAPRSVR